MKARDSAGNAAVPCKKCQQAVSQWNCAPSMALQGLHVLGVRAGGAEMVNKQQILSDCIESTCELVEDKDFKDEQAQLDALHGLPCTPLVIAGQLAARSNTADPPKQ